MEQPSIIPSMALSSTTTDDFDNNHISSQGQGSCLSSRPDENSRWNKHFQDLLEFKRKHHHCLVPHNYADQAGLARWVKRQRYQYKLFEQGKPAFMSHSRIQQLQDIGFVWDSHRANWQKSLQDLIDFRKRYGHCDVPTKYPSNQSLATWVNRQRGQYKLFRAGKQSSINLSRFEALEQLGFRWEVRNFKKNKSPEINKKMQAPVDPLTLGKLPSPIKSVPISQSDYNFFMDVLCDLSDDGGEDVADAVGLNVNEDFEKVTKDGKPEQCFSDNSLKTATQTHGLLQEVLCQIQDDDSDVEGDKFDSIDFDLETVSREMF